MKLTELYSDYFANWISGGSFIKRDKISLIGLRSLFDRYLTNSWITKIWVITSLPVNFDINLTQDIRSEMYEAYPEIRTIVHMYNEPEQVKVHTDNYKRQLTRATTRYEQLANMYEELNSAEQMTGVSQYIGKGAQRFVFNKDTLNRAKEESDSYSYVYTKAKGGLGFTNTYYFIQASSKNTKSLLQYRKTLANLLGTYDITFHELHGNIGDYLECFCPGGYKKRDVPKIRSMLFSEENIAAFIPNKTLGLVGASGIEIGANMQSKFPFKLDFLNSGTAQVMLVYSRTGGGKTILCFNIALQLPGLGVHFSAVDIKGNEWNKLQSFIPVKEIAFDGESPVFVNVGRLDDVPCNSKGQALDFFNSAVRGIVNVFDIVVDLAPTEGNKADLYKILNAAAMKWYHSHEVIADNPDTFFRSSSFKYADIIETIQSLKNSQFYNKEQKKICDLIVLRASDFFLSEGRYSKAFKEELTVGEILDSPAIIYNFNKNSNEMLDTLDTLRVYMAQFLDGKKQSYRKSLGQHTVAFYEELSRCKQFGNLALDISHKVTGSRSNNVSIFLLLNSISVFQFEEFAPIKDNITTYFVGKVTNDNVNDLVEHFDCSIIKDYMLEIAEDKTGYLQNCFAVNYDTGLEQNKVICKTMLPKEILNKLKTRDTLDA